MSLFRFIVLKYVTFYFKLSYFEMERVPLIYPPNNEEHFDLFFYPPCFAHQKKNRCFGTVGVVYKSMS